VASVTAMPFLLKGSISSRILAAVWARSDMQLSLVGSRCFRNAMGREWGGGQAEEALMSALGGSRTSRDATDTLIVVALALIPSAHPQPLAQ
jgi:hypothetical protein